MGEMTFSFDKLGIVVQILEGLNPWLDVVPLDNKTIGLTKKVCSLSIFTIQRVGKLKQEAMAFFFREALKKVFPTNFFSGDI